MLLHSREFDRTSCGNRLKRLVDGKDVVELRMFTSEKELLCATVIELIKKNATCRFTISTGPARFLVIGFQRTRHLIMDHETNVRLIDAHTEGVGGYDRFQFPGHKR